MKSLEINYNEIILLCKQRGTYEKCSFLIQEFPILLLNIDGK